VKKIATGYETFDMAIDVGLVGMVKASQLVEGWAVAVIRNESLDDLEHP
jgi:hypothetical protein